MFRRVAVCILLVAGVQAQTPLPPGSGTSTLAIVYRATEPKQSSIRWRGFPGLDREEHEVGLPSSVDVMRSFPGGFAISPNKRWIAFVYRSNLWIALLGNSTPFQYAIQTSSRLLDTTWSHAVRVSFDVGREVGWSSDSSNVVYTHHVGTSNQMNVMTVSVATTATLGGIRLGTPVQVTNRLSGDTNHDETPMFSPDGNFILFCRPRVIGSIRPFRVPSTGGEPIEVSFGLPVGGFTAAAWSPDGRKIVMVRQGGFIVGTGFVEQGIYVMNGDGTGLIKLEGTGGGDAEPRFSPDGTKVLFTRAATPFGSHSAIYVGNSTNPCSPAVFIEQASVDYVTPDWISLTRASR